MTPWCYYDNDKSTFVSHLWIRDGSGAVCTECGVMLPEIEKYAPPDLINEDQEKGL